MKNPVFLLISLLVIMLILSGCQKDKNSSKTKAKKELNEINIKTEKTKARKKLKEKAVSEKNTVGKKFGYIKTVYLSSNKTPYLKIDYANMFTGKEARKVAAKEGHKEIDNDYYISNVNPKIRTFEIADSAKFIMQTWELADKGKISNKEISFSDFMNIFNNNNENSKRMAASPYWITLNNNKVVKVMEQYLP